MLLIFSVLRAHIVPYFVTICMFPPKDFPGGSEDTFGSLGGKENRSGTVSN